jgi:hypothetical protein
MRMRRVIVAGSSGIQAATRGPASLVPRYFGPLRPQSPLARKARRRLSPTTTRTVELERLRRLARERVRHSCATVETASPAVLSGGPAVEPPENPRNGPGIEVGGFLYRVTPSGL